MGKCISIIRQFTLQLLSYTCPWPPGRVKMYNFWNSENTKVLLLDATNQLTNSSSNEMCPVALKAGMWILNPLFSWLYDTKICCTSCKRPSNTRYYTPVKAYTILNQSQGKGHIFQVWSPKCTLQDYWEKIILRFES